MQTAYATDPAFGRIGMLADARIMKHTASRLAAGTVKAGYGVFRVPGFGQPGSRLGDPGQVYQNPSPAAAVDVDAILATGGASAASIQVWEGTELNGVVGGTEMFPARQVTLVLSNHADWDATTAVARYINHLGVDVTENLAIPNGGNTTLTTTGYVSRFISLTIPVQSGAGGTFTIGITVLDGTVNLSDFVGIAVYDSSVESPAYLQGDTTTAEYKDKATVPVLQKGAAWVTTEDACVAGGDVYVRIGTGAGGSQLGAFRSDADTASAVQVTGARWGRDSSAGGLNIVEMF